MIALDNCLREIEWLRTEWAKSNARVKTLETALHIAFMAMCAQRDNPDAEVFQDAIDALGLAANKEPA
jgi:hypothetical protein